jgi:predicted RNA binding protein YcfA (HicA-like mRNA interferase family)
VKVSELRRVLEKNGWYIVRHGANHDLYGHPERLNEPPVPVGRHMSKEIKKGTANSILKQAGLK